MVKSSDVDSNCMVDIVYVLHLVDKNRKMSAQMKTSVIEQIPLSRLFQMHVEIPSAEPGMIKKMAKKRQQLQTHHWCMMEMFNKEWNALWMRWRTLTEKQLPDREGL